MARLNVLTDYSNCSLKKESDNTFEPSLLKTHMYLYLHLKLCQCHHQHHPLAHTYTRVIPKSSVAIAFASKSTINNSILLISALFIYLMPTPKDCEPSPKIIISTVVRRCHLCHCLWHIDSVLYYIWWFTKWCAGTTLRGENRVGKWGTRGPIQILLVDLYLNILKMREFNSYDKAMYTFVRYILDSYKWSTS